MKTITCVELKQLLDEDSKIAVIDVRTLEEYAEVHVEAAGCLPLDTLEPGELVNAGQLPKSEPIYILCRSGKRARTAADRFVSEGLDNAVVVEGGTLAWIEAGLPVVHGAEDV
jgi:rhodanese-related sulfurtransferase